MKGRVKNEAALAAKSKVFIVGAGPGAKDLISVRGMNALSEADIVFYDALVNPDILEHTSQDAEKVFVGKRCGRKVMEQSEINQRIIEAARSGKTVVRLKGGDPFVFGRGGEEALACRSAGISYEIIPGIPSAVGAAAYSGIPLTHRGTAASVAFITARDYKLTGKGRTLAGIAAAVDTLVIFMGGLQVREIANELTAGNISPKTPAAVISHGTLPEQKTVFGVLDNIADRVSAAALRTPMLIIIGQVADLGPLLGWFGAMKSAQSGLLLEAERYAGIRLLRSVDQ
ncbi:MAG: uroporphyrinogen-III C-methyltransferase [Acidobacteria bacterium]|nr:uroporphyrinogen-III C-methyltransferase [Acidobacteriota bacterium]